jgi:hypothetical protein
VLQEQQPWIDTLQTLKTGVYMMMRVRIALRKKGLIPLEDKKAEEELIEASKKRQEDFKVTKDDVLNAFYEGHEVSCGYFYWDGQ